MLRDKHNPTDPQLVAWRERLTRLEWEPDAALWERIAAELPQRRRRWRFWPLATVAAALVGLVVGLSLRPTSAPKVVPTEAAGAQRLPLPAKAVAVELPAPQAVVASVLPKRVPVQQPQVAQSLPVQPATPERVPRPESQLQPLATTEIGPLAPFEHALELFATANYCQSHVRLNEARKHVCAREPLEQINLLMSYIETRVSSECLCLAYEEASNR